jgi:CRISPR system Cascade subunit CasB
MTETHMDSTAAIAPTEGGATHTNPYGALAAHVQKAGAGDRAALARLDPDALRPNDLAALARALMAAGLAPENWRPETWTRWASIAHGMAMAGHDGHEWLGRQLARAGVSETRVTRLLTARGDAFGQLLPRVLRLLASQSVAPNWFELGELVLKQASADPADAQRAEQLRLRIAGAYFATPKTPS